MKFTQLNVEKIKSNPDKKTFITDDEMKGLTLYVGKTGMKVWYYYFRDANGKKASRKLGSTDALTVAQAREMVKKFAGQLVQGEDIRKEKPADKPTLGNFLSDCYFPYLRTTHKTAREIIRSLSVDFKPYLGKLVEEINPWLIEKWRETRRERGLKAASINRATAYLKAAFNWGYRSGILEQNPIARIAQLKERDSEEKVRFLTPDERERLEVALIEREKRIRAERESGNKRRTERGDELLPRINCEFADYMRPAVLLSLATGIRQGALFALKWGDIDFETQTVTLRADDAKNGKTKRLPLCDDAIDILGSWRSQSANTSPDALIFPSPKTNGKIQEIKTAWSAILKAADIQNFRWHDLRHDFASQLVMKGVDLNVVRELMCHADMKMTLRYAHLAPESKLNAVQVLNRRTQGSKIIGHIRSAASNA